MNRGARKRDEEQAGRSERGSREDESRNVPAPFGNMSPLTREMDRMFDGFWRNPFGLLSSRGGAWNGGGASDARWAPELELHEHDGEFVVRADLPGMRKEDVDVEVVGQTLVIRGERTQGCESEENGWHHSECRYGRFVRSVPLPESVDAEQIRAEFRDGILELRMPAPDRKESRRKIQVREGGQQRGQDAREST